MEAQKVFKRIGWTMFFFVIAYQFVFGSTLTMLISSIIGQGTISSVIGALLSDGLVFLLCWIMLRPLPQEKITPKQKISAKYFIVVFAVAVCVVSAIGTMSSLLLEGIYNLFGLDYSSQIATSVAKEGFIGSFITVALIAPIFEELIFRKLLFERLLPYGKGLTIFITALSFGLMHGTFEQVPYTFVMGIAFGYLMAITGDIRVPILCHIINNFLSNISLLLQNSGGLTVLGAKNLIDLSIPILGLVLIIISLVKNKGRLQLPQEIASVKKNDAIAAIKNPGYITFIVLQMLLTFGTPIIMIVKALFLK